MGAKETLTNGVARASRLGARYERCNHGLEVGVPNTACELGKLQAPKARSCDCRRHEAPNDYGVWGKCRSLPQWGPRRSPTGTNAILNISCQKGC